MQRQTSVEPSAVRRTTGAAQQSGVPADGATGGGGHARDDEKADADFLIVGGGCGGCVIARRLADAGFTVILIEAGPDPLAGPTREASEDPMRCPELWRTSGWMAQLKSDESAAACDYGFLTAPEHGLGGRRVPLNSGRALGGGSAINNGLYGVDWAEPEAAPWSEWQQTFGLSQWSPAAMANAVQRARAAVQPQLPPEHARMRAFDEAMAECLEPPTAGSIPPPGATRVLWCVDTSMTRRRSAATAYLGDGDADAAASSARPPTLHVMPDTEVGRLLLEDGGCVGVELLHTSGAGGTADRGAAHAPCVLTAAREVIVCCGAILTPTLLLRSGIGPAAELAAHGVACAVASPHVGQNLITQLSLPLSLPPAVLARGPPPPWSGPACQPVAPIKVPIGRSVEAALFQWSAKGTLYALCLARPLSRGTVTLERAAASAGPADTAAADDATSSHTTAAAPSVLDAPTEPAAATRPSHSPPSPLTPRIEFGLLAHPADVSAMVAGLRRFEAALRAPTAAKLNTLSAADGALPAFPTAADDPVAWLRERAATTRHPLGTCRLGHGIGDGVCDQSGRVFAAAATAGSGGGGSTGGRGVVRGLRVGCNSLAPSAPPDTHVMRVALAIGERIAELVLEEYGARGVGGDAVGGGGADAVGLA